MPYREVPQAAVTHQPDDSASVTRAIELRDRFGRLEANKLWPPPADRPFSAHNTNVLALSGDGKRALVFASSHAWILDTATMVASAPIRVPDDADIAVLDLEGKIALFIADGTLYHWEVDAATPDFQEVWQSAELSRTNSLRMTPDARVATATYRSCRATIRVFDLQAMTMTYSFEADADESLILHPSGQHIVCFGDDRIARIYGENGFPTSIKECTGGAFSPDGKKLLTNAYDEKNQVRVYKVILDGARMAIGYPSQYLVRQKLKTWDWRANFSPSGDRALLEGVDNELVVLDFHKSPSVAVDVKMNWATAFAADETTILSPSISAREFGVHSDGIAIAQAESQELQGILCATRSDPPVLAAITPLGLYGSIEAEARPTSEEFTLPYERPALMSQMLSRTGSPLERSEQKRLDEVSARREAWWPYYELLTDDIGDRDLMAINRGLVELTPEIVHRAKKAMVGLPRFGSPQLGLAALQAAGEQLRALGVSGRQPVFESMIRRMRGTQEVSLAVLVGADEDDDGNEGPRGRSSADARDLDRLLGPSAPPSLPPALSLTAEATAPAPDEDEQWDQEESAMVTTTGSGLSRFSKPALLGFGAINLALWGSLAYLFL